MADPRRIRRLEAAILQTVAPLVSTGLADPRLSLVTVTRIRLSRDLSVARVNWSVLGEAADRSRAAHALEHARGALTKAVAQRLQTRVTPRLEFHFDPSLEKAQRINEVLAQLERERAEREGPPADEAADEEE